jgi:hypothetical protein
MGKKQQESRRACGMSCIKYYAVAEELMLWGISLKSLLVCLSLSSPSINPSCTGRFVLDVQMSILSRDVDSRSSRRES